MSDKLCVGCEIELSDKNGSLMDGRLRGTPHTCGRVGAGEAPKPDLFERADNPVTLEDWRDRCDFLEREMANYRRNATHRAEQLAKEMVAESRPSADTLELAKEIVALVDDDPLDVTKKIKAIIDRWMQDRITRNANS